MPRDTRAAFLAELRRIAPQIARAFEAAVQDIRSTAQRRVIEDAIRRAVASGDIVRGMQDVSQALSLGAEFWAPLDRQIQEAFNAGAIYQMAVVPRTPIPSVGPLVVRFNGRHPRAEAWSRDRSAALITEITTDTEVLIRELIAEAVEESRPYRRVTSELIGTVDGNERKGGLVGLHSRQAAAVRAARRDLEALDPRYFTRERRDRRFDRTVSKAIREGVPLSREDVDRITGRYADRLLRLRGETISRTEGNKAMNAGRAEVVTQMIEGRQVPVEAITKIWDATPGPRTRDSHVALNGQEVPWTSQFVSPVTLARLDHPHDENAPAGDTVNCRCTMRTRIDYRRVAQWRERFEVA